MFFKHLDVGLANVCEMKIKLKSEVPIYYSHYISEGELVTEKIYILKE